MSPTTTPPVVITRDEPVAGSTVIGPEPVAGRVMDVIVAFSSVTILACFLTRKYLTIRNWKKVPFIAWIVIAIFIDSWLFIVVTSILKHGVGIDISTEMCSSAILLCLICYVTTKVLIYMFLVEKAFVVRNGTKRRMKSKLYLFNSFGMLSLYVVVGVLNFIFRIARIDDGQCIIGMEKLAMIPLISFDLLVNVYLTVLFLIPLRKLYSFKGKAQPSGNASLRTMALRTFIGAVSTTISSVVNLTVLMALNGEPGWVCLLCCNIDILFSAVVVQWITSRDSTGNSSNAKNSHYAHYAHDTNSRPGNKDIVRRVSFDVHRSAAGKNGHRLDDDLEMDDIGGLGHSYELSSATPAYAAGGHKSSIVGGIATAISDDRVSTISSKELMENAGNSKAGSGRSSVDAPSPAWELDHYNPPPPPAGSRR